jgi:DNA polymerase-3 subunit epsilon/ATP-dependent DNA helicase DinG
MTSLRAATLKGRRNYLCLLRWSQARRRPATDLYELAMLIRLLIWVPRTQTGDRAELNISQPEDPAWDRLSARNENCLAGPCQYVKQGTCFLLRARKRAESAHLLVVNHALLLSDLAAEGGVLPSYGHLVIDEAHNLEEEATRTFGFEVSRTGIDDLLSSISTRKTGGLTGLVRTMTRMSPAGSRTGELIDHLDVLVAQAETAAESFFEGLARLIDEAGAEGDGERQLSLTKGTRAQPSWSKVEVYWDNLAAPLYQIEEGLLKLFAAMVQGGGAGGPEVESVVMQTDAAASQIHDLAEGLNLVISRHDPDRVAWLSVTRRGDISVSSAPLSVSTILGRQLFDQKQSIILTSATLTAAGTFDYLKQRVGLESGEELLLDSPFDFKEAVQLLLPSDFPEPHEAGYQAACEEAISEVAEASAGRSLALFTSHSALRATYHSIRSELEGKGIQVLAQGLDGSARQLITALKENHRTLLLGTASFWEGIDIAGEALSTLIIARLPFPVPVDPIFAARSELYDDPFNEFALPQAILRFKQGFGRLIRHRDDRGLVVVLDRRLLSKSYGEAFLRSLPTCSVSSPARRDLAGFVKPWLAAAGRTELTAAST